MPETCNFFKKENLAHSCFFVSSVKFLRTHFLTEHIQWLLLYLAFFSVQLANTITNFEAILTVREKEYKKQFVKCFLNVIYSDIKKFYIVTFFTISNILVNHWTTFS